MATRCNNKTDILRQYWYCITKSAGLLLDNGTSTYLKNDPITNAPQDVFFESKYFICGRKERNKEIF